MDKKITGVVSYCTIIGWIIAYILGDKENAKFHMNQSLVVCLTSLILNVLLGIVKGILGAIPLIGGLLSAIVGILNIIPVIFMILGIIYAIRDEDKELPFIGGIKILK